MSCPCSKNSFSELLAKKQLEAEYKKKQLEKAKAKEEKKDGKNT